MKKININELKKLNVAEAMTYLKTTNEGLSSSIIATRRLDYGNNEMPKAKKDNKFITITKAIFNPFNLILLGLAVISLFTDIIYAKEKDYTTIAIILTMVSLSTLIKIIQDFKAERAFSNLAKLIENKVRVRRDGKEVTIPLSELVIGDYLILSVGEIVPADIRIVDSNQFYVDESSLTGESEPIFKNSIPTEETDLLKASNIAFMGSLVKSGSAEGLVCQLCKDTYYGQIASSLQQKKKLTSFDKGIRKVSHLLVGFMLIMVPIVFIINGFTTSNWLGAFLFAIAIAVGLTPEMLPMIVTTCLAKGSVEMGHKKTIIKDMNAIQNLGAMDILCTDKTGTLTNNQMEVIDTLNVLGESDKKVLLYASLNSYYQTGYQNPLDVAIMASHPQEKFTKVGELPYDFERRMLSMVGYYDAKLLVITKGAVHEILTKSSSYLVAGKVKPMTNDLLFQLEKRNVSWLNEGKRVLAVAIKEDLNTTNFTYSDETNLCLVGFITLSDEPKPSAYKTIKALKEHGVAVKILTGDSVQNTSYICRQIGLGEVKAIDGLTLSKWSEEKLAKEVNNYQVFAKLTPSQKELVVTALKNNGHTVGFMGDGINDVQALKAADVAISVDEAQDIAKDVAQVVLLENDLEVLKEGIIIGRKTYVNMMKYIKMTASSNFGNMLSVLFASALLPFLPMLSLQILLLNLVYDICSMALPWDKVDEKYLLKPQKWQTTDLKRFMFYMGPVSSLFDILTYLLLYFVICPQVAGGRYNDALTNQTLFIAVFHAGWFIESMWTQTLVIQVMRTEKVPFFKAKPSIALIVCSVLGIIILTILPYTKMADSLGFAPLPLVFFSYLIALVAGYLLLISLVKRIYIHKYSALL